MTTTLSGWTFSQVPIWVTCDHRLSDKAARIFAYLHYRQGTDPTCFPGIPKIAADLGCSENTVRRAHAELEEHGYLEITPRPGRSNLYRLTACPPGSEEFHPDRTPSKNVRGPLPKMESPPSKNGTHDDNHEQEKRTKDRAASPRPSAPAFEEPDLPEVVDFEMVDETDQEITCPMCGEIWGVRFLEKSAAECKACGQPFRVRDWHGKVVCRPRQSARRKESGGSSLDGFGGKPVNAFCALIRTPPGNLPPKTRGQWGRKLQEIGNANDADAEAVADAIASIPKSEYSWMTFSSPFQNTFWDVLTVILLRRKPSQGSPEVATQIASLIARINKERE